MTNEQKIIKKKVGLLKLAREKYQGVNDRHLQELLAREHGTTVRRARRRPAARAYAGR